MKTITIRPEVRQMHNRRILDQICTDREKLWKMLVENKHKTIEYKELKEKIMELEGQML